MDNKQTEDHLKNIAKPSAPDPNQKEILKLALLNARKSSAIGIVLVGLPAILIALSIIQNAFQIHAGIISRINQFMPSVPIQTRAVFFFIFLVGSPLIAIALNILSITYFQYDKNRREFNITIKIRWWNIIITLVGAAFASFYVFHILADSLMGGK